jgi:hypothetical protein
MTSCSSVSDRRPTSSRATRPRRSAWRRRISTSIRDVCLFARHDLGHAGRRRRRAQLGAELADRFARLAAPRGGLGERALVGRRLKKQAVERLLLPIRVAPLDEAGREVGARTLRLDALPLDEPLEDGVLFAELAHLFADRRGFGAVDLDAILVHRAAAIPQRLEAREAVTDGGDLGLEAGHFGLHAADLGALSGEFEVQREHRIAVRGERDRGESTRR